MTLFIDDKTLIYIIPSAIVLFVLLLILVLSIKIVRQNQQVVIERLGVYHTTWRAGIHFLFPFVDRVVKKVSVSDQLLETHNDFLTIDQVHVYVDFDVIYQIADTKQYVYGYDRNVKPITSLVSHYLRVSIGEKDFKTVLSDRNLILLSDFMKFDEVTDNWGLKIKRVQIKKILIYKGDK
ncbi:hypothetical protein BN85407800 [Alteracholeplasma palmae J233]|uniref:Band 7 domain-containing protein n=1 Tax=Alteracholeplasma palmae (strain ATCC 49389 / J233) TaxID=1318466 RepID=U4KKX0_ALTPJ|nr:SPFH domain-containing protein [Alteracholeplasma palmae]CCV64357.1 hypothetical protein BN85407800 [Alteracholeplasma palmae J233]